MKIVTANKKQKLVLSKKEWTSIGKKAGWMKKAQVVSPEKKQFPWEQTVKIKLVDNGANEFPSGAPLDFENDKKFLKDNVGKIFNAVWHDREYYLLIDSGILVHESNAIQV